MRNISNFRKLAHVLDEDAFCFFRFSDNYEQHTLGKCYYVTKATWKLKVLSATEIITG